MAHALCGTDPLRGKQCRLKKRALCVLVFSIVNLRTLQENALQQFIEKYGDRIVGVLSGFDRLVLRGSPKALVKAFFTRSLVFFR